MAELDSIGLVEVTSIAQGYLVEDAMLKAARVDLLLARTICSGKYLIVVGADVASVEAAVDAGAQAAGATLIERRVLPHVHASVFPAVAGTVDLDVDGDRALGVIETFSASSVIEVADAAAKAAHVTLLRVHVAMAIGGHRTEAIYWCYDIVSGRDLQEAGRRLDGYLKSKWKPKDKRTHTQPGGISHTTRTQKARAVN